MQQDKIDTFYDTMHALASKRRAFADAAYELECQIACARDALNDTIDNGISCKEAEDAHAEYSTCKFNSKAVQHLISKVDALILADLSQELRSHLELIAMHFSVSHGYDKTYCSGPIYMHFAYKTEGQERRCFQLSIPVKGTVHSDMKKWNGTNDGLYCVYAGTNWYSKKLFCKVFDAKKATTAIAKFLNGEFDNELMYDSYIQLQYDGTTLIDEIEPILTRCVYGDSVNAHIWSASTDSFEYSSLDSTSWRTRSPFKHVDTIESCIDDIRCMKSSA